MKIEKLFSYSDKNMIWRLLVSDEDNLIIETRDPSDKKAYFHSLKMSDGRKNFIRKSLVDDFWTGIEEINGRNIILHKYVKPDMPEHTGVYAVDTVSGEEVWGYPNLQYNFSIKNKIYCVGEESGIERKYIIDAVSGEISRAEDEDSSNWKELNEKAYELSDYSDYHFPEFELFAGIEPGVTDDIIKKSTGSVFPRTEVIRLEKILIASIHYLRKDTNLDHKLFAFELDSCEKILDIKLDSKTEKFNPDTFFIYKDILVVIREKTKVIIYKIKGMI